MRKAAIQIIRVTALAYAGFMLVLASCQRGMIYHPTRRTEAEAVRRAAWEALEPWRGANGEIIGWRPVHAREEGDAMVLFHGNAGDAPARSYFAEGFAPWMAVHLFEYPGYGPRGGTPSEQAFAEAGEAAVRQLRRERAGRIFLGGESLGTGVACRLAGAHPELISGLFLSTPFTRMADVARSHHPLYPAGWLMRDRYDSALHLQGYAGPVAILLAGRDEVVPARLGRRLYDAYEGPKQIWIQPDRSHNTVDYAEDNAWWGEVAGFLQGNARP